MFAYLSTCSLFYFMCQTDIAGLPDSLGRKFLLGTAKWVCSEPVFVNDFWSPGIDSKESIPQACLLDMRTAKAPHLSQCSAVDQ